MRPRDYGFSASWSGNASFSSRKVSAIASYSTASARSRDCCSGSVQCAAMRRRCDALPSHSMRYFFSMIHTGDPGPAAAARRTSHRTPDPALRCGRRCEVASRKRPQPTRLSAVSPEACRSDRHLPRIFQRQNDLVAFVITSSERVQRRQEWVWIGEHDRNMPPQVRLACYRRVDRIETPDPACHRIHVHQIATIGCHRNADGRSGCQKPDRRLRQGSRNLEAVKTSR